MTIINRRSVLAGGAATLLASAARAGSASYDVVVYGASAGGVMAAVAAARGGARTILVGGGHYFGGDLANGLAGADTKLAEIGGIFLELFQRVGVIEGLTRPTTTGAPSSVYAAMLDMVTEAGVHTRLDQEMVGIGRDRERIVHVALAQETPSVSTHGVVIDATAMGDMLAATSKRWTVGREAASTYGESLAGYGRVKHIHQFSPYITGTSKLLPQISPQPTQAIGSGDKYIQSATFRPALSMDSDRVPFTVPKHYDPLLYQLELRSLDLAVLSPEIGRPYSMYNLYDWDVSDFVGAFTQYPTATSAQRLIIRRRHIDFLKGWFYFFSHDPSVSKVWRDWYGTLGWAPSQFKAYDHFPPELYVREGRRLVGSKVLREQDAKNPVAQVDPICIGSHSLDAHAVRAIALNDHPNWIQYEGTMGPLKTTAHVGTYQIPYQALVVPDVSNLLIGGTAISASHVFHSAARTRSPSFGEAAGTAAAIAVTSKAPVRELGQETTAALVTRGIPVQAPT